MERNSTMIAKSVWVIYLTFTNPVECENFLDKNPEFIAAQCVATDKPRVRPKLRPTNEVKK